MERAAATDADKDGRDLVVMWMRDLAMRVDVEVGNIVGTWLADALTGAGADVAGPWGAAAVTSTPSRRVGSTTHVRSARRASRWWRRSRPVVALRA
ncbi:MAG: hypothetical protein U0W40_04970 [Acidimicrobiia bacterium]